MVRWVIRLRRRAARLLLPRAFRERHGAEMEATFHEVVADAEARAGHLGVGWALLAELVDLARAAVRLRSHPSLRDRLSDGVRSLARAGRTLARRPGFTAVAAGTVALGVAASTATFALVEGILLRPLPYPEPERLVQLFQTNPELGWERGPVSFPNFHDWRTHATVFESLSAYEPGVRRALVTDAGPRQVSGSRVSGEIFRTLGVRPLLGRALGPRDEGASGSAVVLSYDLWLEAFGADSAVVGRAVRLGDERVPVVAVLPADLPPLWSGDDFWIPFDIDPADADRDRSSLSVLGRTKAGVTPAAAEAALEELIRRIELTSPEGNEGRNAHVERRHEVVTGHVASGLLVLLGAGGLLLLIGCANLAGLMVTRATGRARELAVRTALGAGRGRVVGALFTEALVITGIGALLALPLARLLVEAALTLGPPDLPRRQEIELGLPSVAFGLGAALATAIVASLFPAARSWAVDLRESLAVAGGRRGDGGGATRSHRALVVVQVALAVVLMTGAGLFADTLLALQGVERGFDEESVLTFRLAPSPSRYPGGDALDAFYTEVVDGVRGVPNVEAVGATWALPFGDAFGSSSYMVEGRLEDESYLLELLPVRGDYFEAMRIPLVRGRGFRPGDGVDGSLVTILNRSLADRIWPGEDPIGKRLRKGSGESAVFAEVVGVVPDVVTRTIGEEPAMLSFWPHAATPWARDLYVTVRTTDEPLDILPRVRAVVGRIDPSVPLADVRTMSARVHAQLAGPRFRTLLVTGFAFAATLLALLGVYGVTSYAVVSRSHEIGVRMALGARRGEVRLAILRSGGGLAALGALLGLAVATVGSRTLEGLLFGVEPVEPAVYLGAATLVVGATIAATWIPARRASAVDPGRALRSR